MGNLLSVVIHAANIHDTKSGINPAKQAFEKYPTIKKFCADEGYRKSFENDVSEQLDLVVDISKRIKPEFVILPKRWVVERTFAWLNGFRRLSKDYEITTSSEAANVTIAHCAILLNLLRIQVLRAFLNYALINNIYNRFLQIKLTMFQKICQQKMKKYKTCEKKWHVLSI